MRRDAVRIDLDLDELFEGLGYGSIRLLIACKALDAPQGWKLFAEA